MARTTTLYRDIRAQLLRARDPVSATELASLLRVNRTTSVRALPELGDELLTMGATRSTRFLLRSIVRNLGNRWPIYRIDEAGQARQWAYTFWLRGCDDLRITADFRTQAEMARGVIHRLRDRI